MNLRNFFRARRAVNQPDTTPEIPVLTDEEIQARIDKARDEDIWALANAVGLDHRADRLFLESALDTGVVPTQHARHLVVVP